MNSNDICLSNTVSCEECGAKKLCIRNILNTPQQEELNFFTRNLHTFHRGESLFQAGNDSQSLYILKSGSAKSVLTAENGDEQIINFHFPGEIIGLDNLTKSKHFLTAVFLENANVCKIDKSAFNKLEDEILLFRLEVISRLTEETTHLSQLLLSTNHLTAEQKLATFILELSGRMALIGVSEFLFRISMSRIDIANYLGLASETVSRLFKKIERDRLIEVKNKNLRILDIQKLISRTHGCEACIPHLSAIHSKALLGEVAGNR